MSSCAWFAMHCSWLCLPFVSQPCSSGTAVRMQFADYTVDCQNTPGSRCIEAANNEENPSCQLDMSCSADGQVLVGGNPCASAAPSPRLLKSAHVQVVLLCHSAPDAACVEQTITMPCAAHAWAMPFHCSVSLLMPVMPLWSETIKK
eukprot:jgi/Ulvmu1/11430/UM076_0004.1